MLFAESYSCSLYFITNFPSFSLAGGDDDDDDEDDEEGDEEEGEMGTAALLGPEIADDPADAAEDFEPEGDDDGTSFNQ